VSGLIREFELYAQDVLAQHAAAFSDEAGARVSVTFEDEETAVLERGDERLRVRLGVAVVAAHDLSGVEQRPVTWQWVTWGEVRVFDRVRAGGEERIVTSVWPIDWKGRGGRVVIVRLAGRDLPYEMPVTRRIERAAVPR
jgi:hypothetical protein